MSEPIALDPLFAVEAVLEDWGPKADATAGSPHESGLMLHDDAVSKVGVWQCTPGSWVSAKDGVGELMHFVSGHGWITDDDGRWEIAPGAVRWFPDGWRGRWDVDVTVRKVFAIITATPAS